MKTKEYLLNYFLKALRPQERYAVEPSIVDDHDFLSLLADNEDLSSWALLVEFFYLLEEVGVNIHNQKLIDEICLQIPQENYTINDLVELAFKYQN